MRSSGHVGRWGVFVTAPYTQAALPVLAVHTQRRRFASTQPSSTEGLDSDGSANASTTALSSSSSSPTAAAPPSRYRRRSSDPQTLRERADFRRDHKYAKYRPLPDAPWRRLKTKTYLDDAERLYGRKETWQAIEDAVLREKLVAILQDYLRDTLAAARLEAKEARKYQHLCSIAARQYRAHVSSGAFGLAANMQEWAAGVLRGRAAADDASAGQEAGDGSDESETVTASGHEEGGGESQEGAAPTATGTEESAAAEFREERRRRGERALLAHTAAMADLPEADARHTPQSAFPFLRRRAIEDEATLDPSLVDWTAKYFPEDDARTFAEPPRLRVSATSPDGTSAGNGDAPQPSHSGTPGAAESAALSPSPSPSGAATRRPGTVHARHRLQRTLRDHQNRRRATFDAEGIYFKVRRQSETDERAPKPQAVRASDLEQVGRQPDVVKVPWSVAAQAKAQGYSSATLRAKERLIRLTRGEDPETIP